MNAVLPFERSGIRRESRTTSRVPSLPDSFAAGAVHDVLAPATAHAVGAGTRFIAHALVTRAPAGPVLWAAARSDLYPPGLACLGLDPSRLILAEATREADRLAALETALAGGLHGVAEIEDLSRLAARRLALAARKGGGIGFVLRTRRSGDSTACATRWRILPALSGTAGRPRLAADLLYARGADPDSFLLEPDHHATPPALTVVARLADPPSPARRHRRAG